MSSEIVPLNNGHIQIIIHMCKVSSRSLLSSHTFCSIQWLADSEGADKTAWPRGYKTFSCSSQLSMKFFMLINLRLVTIANSFLLNIAEHENFSANKYENANFCWQPTFVGIFIFIRRENFMLSWVEHEKKFFNLWAWSDCADAQADLVLRCRHTPEDTFSHGVAHLMYNENRKKKQEIVTRCNKSTKYIWVFVVYKDFAAGFLLELNIISLYFRGEDTKRCNISG